jgi:hypothetical protein
MIEYRATCDSCGWVSLTYEQQNEAEAARLRHETTHEDHDTWMHALPVRGRSLPGRSAGHKRRPRRAPPDSGPCSIRTQRVWDGSRISHVWKGDRSHLLADGGGEP